ncbi:MAG: hypothetical protein HGA76_06350 [Candidatus Firestonebacteria bacterium]|nr:hypothetical protein [Candidatus Firestonebacteria bacterium]
MVQADQIKKNISRLFLSGLFLLSLVPSFWALSSNYAEVFFENLRIGNTYDLSELTNMPFTLGNGQNKVIDMKIEVLKPLKNQLRSGFEPIPDVKWVVVKDTRFTVAAKGTFKTSIKLIIPNQKKYLGKKYQVCIETAEVHTEGGINVAFAVTSKILFSTAPVQDALRVTKSKQLKLNFKMIPDVVYLDDVVLGKETEVKNLDGKPVQLVNSNDSEIVAILESVLPDSEMFNLMPEYEFSPDAKFLKFPSGSLAVPANAKRDFPMTVEFPADPKYAGKKYEFFISVTPEVENQNVTGVMYLRVLVSTQGASKSKNVNPSSQGNTGSAVKP